MQTFGYHDSLIIQENHAAKEPQRRQAEMKNVRKVLIAVLVLLCVFSAAMAESSGCCAQKRKQTEDTSLWIPV